MFADGLADEPADGGRAERFQADRAGAGAVGQPAERLGLGGEFVGAVGHDDEHREFLGAGREGGQPAQRLGVGPVGVVEYEHHRGPPDGDVGEHPVEAVREALRVGGRARAVGAQSQGGADDAVPAAEGGAEHLVAGSGELGLEQLAGDVEGDALFLVAAAGVQDGAAEGGGPAPGLREQGRLAETRGGGEGQHAATPCAAAGVFPIGAYTRELGQRLVDGHEFGLAFEERPPGLRCAPRHSAPPAPDPARAGSAPVILGRLSGGTSAYATGDPA